MTPGYYGDAEATAERFVTIGGLQFFRTGDIGEMVDGQFQVAKSKSKGCLTLLKHFSPF